MLRDRVQQTSTTTGTGTYSLTGTVANRQTFVGAGFAGKQCYYLAEENGVGFELGIGTVTDLATDTLSRDTVILSSNGNLAVNWAAGTRQIACAPLAELLGAMGGRLIKGTVGGTANAITVTTPVPLRALTDGAVVLFDPTADSTAAVTLNVDSTGAVALKDSIGGAFDATKILKSGQTCLASYKASTAFWHVLSALQRLAPALAQVAGTTYTIANADKGKTLLFTSGTGCTVTLSAASGLDDDFWVRVISAAGGVVQIDRNATPGTDTIQSKNSSLASLKLPTAGDGGELVLDPVADKFYWRGKRSKRIQFGYALSLDSTNAHDLGVVPDAIMTSLVNTITEEGYAVGNVVQNQNVTVNAGTGWGTNYDATNIETHTAAAAPWIVNKTTNAIAAITAANWDLRHDVMVMN